MATKKRLSEAKNVRPGMCMTCAYWEQESDEFPEWGQCKRHAPSNSEWMDYEGQRIRAAVWPEVHGFDDCGDYCSRSHFPSKQLRAS